MNKGLIVCIFILGSLSVSVWYIVKLSSDIAVLKSKEQDVKALSLEYEETIKNSRSDCEKKVRKAIEHERRANDFKDDINNPDSGIINFDFGV